MGCGAHGMGGHRVRRHVAEGKCKGIVHVQIQNLNILDEIAMEQIGKEHIAISRHVL